MADQQNEEIDEQQAQEVRDKLVERFEQEIEDTRHAAGKMLANAEDEYSRTVALIRRQLSTGYTRAMRDACAEGQRPPVMAAALVEEMGMLLTSYAIIFSSDPEGAVEEMFEHMEQNKEKAKGTVRKYLSETQQEMQGNEQGSDSDG